MKKNLTKLNKEISDLNYRIGNIAALLVNRKLGEMSKVERDIAFELGRADIIDFVPEYGVWAYKQKKENKYGTGN